MQHRIPLAVAQIRSIRPPLEAARPLLAVAVPATPVPVGHGRSSVSAGAAV